jgi:adenine-specific DNA-methyltransferase
MNYIGSKYSLLDFIDHTIKSVVGEDMSQLVFCDLFAGTGIVGRHFKTQVSQVISNDWEYYSYILNRNYIGNHLEIEGKDEYIEKLNQLDGIDNGFIYSQYCLGGGNNRQYFSDENGKKIDAARVAIEEWKNSGEISDDLYYFLLCSLIESADKHANTASVYGAFLKSLKNEAFLGEGKEISGRENKERNKGETRNDRNVLAGRGDAGRVRAASGRSGAR